MKGIMNLNTSDQELIQQDVRRSKKPVPEFDTWVILSWAVVIVFFWYLIIGSWQSLLTNSLQNQSIHQPILATRAKIQLGSSLGRLEVGVNRTGQLINANLEISNNERLVQQFGIQNGIQLVRLESKVIRPNITFAYPMSSNSDWFVQLAPNVPLDLKVQTGVGAARLDLTELQIGNLTVNSGVGRLIILFPSSGQVAARVDGGVGEIKLLIPSGMKSQVRVVGGIGKVNVVGHFIHNNNLYTTDGFETAQNRLKLEISGGIGRIQIEEANW
jgi:hypothetical protein